MPSFCSQNNTDQCCQSRLLLVVSYCMSLTRIGYGELGIKLVSLEENRSHHPRKPPMVEEKRDAGVEYLVKLFLTESLMQ
jgi:hypothetical protein